MDLNGHPTVKRLRVHGTGQNKAAFGQGAHGGRMHWRKVKKRMAAFRTAEPKLYPMWKPMLDGGA